MRFQHVRDKETNTPEATIAFDEKGEKIGISICSEKDYPHKVIGRIISELRAEQRDPSPNVITITIPVAKSYPDDLFSELERVWGRCVNQRLEGMHHAG